MLLNSKSICMVILAATSFVSCQEKKSETTSEVTQPQTEQISEPKEISQNTNPKKGTHVASNLVCMVNDAYMGKEQIEVVFEGKKYYGCCNMCKEKIPKEEKVRYAVDPFSLKKIDKANAYIVVIGDNGEVAYFENENSYKSFLKGNK
ncbi:hypothetical protein H1R17_00565 [Flavobacterium sp. xlx-214]|nr:hypothetical protein [Flavobacterium sp. xlx-221]QMI83674.1 hypothetical protein H1R17_00565 [Flavobacterium sp. xlx-214]